MIKYLSLKLDPNIWSLGVSYAKDIETIETRFGFFNIVFDLYQARTDLTKRSKQNEKTVHNIVTYRPEFLRRAGRHFFDRH